MDENNFNNGLDDLLNMFKKLMENQDLDAIPGINEEQKEQLKMFLEDFDEIKDDMKVEIYKLDPFTKQMVGMVIMMPLLTLLSCFISLMFTEIKEDLRE